MAIYGYTKNYKLIKPQFDTDTWHDYIYDNLDTIDAIMSAIYSSGNWQGFWKKNTHYDVGDVIIDQNTDTMYKVLVEHTTSENTFALEQAAHPTYYELWSPNQLAEDWAIKMDGLVSFTDYSAKAYAISSELIDAGSAKEWAVKTDGTIGTTGEYSAKKHATDASSSASTAIAQASAASASATLAQQWAVDANLVASTDYSSKSWATGSLDAGSAKDWAIKEGGQVGTTGKYSAKVYSLAAENHYEKARDWASKTNGQVESTDYSAKAYAISEGLISAGSAKEWSNKAKAWATSTTIVEDGKYGASYYALQAYNANVTAQIAKTTAQEWASKTDAQVASTDYSSKAYSQSEGLISTGSSKEWATKMDGTVNGVDYSSKYYAGQAAISAAGTHFKLFQHQWFDYEVDDMAWLRADTFSWQDGTVYSNAYNHLVADIDGITASTETVGGYTVTFYRAADGHKIVLADQETTVNNIYTATGVAWYYVLDTDNTRFKLPRTKYGFDGLRGNVGDYVPESLPNITGNIYLRYPVPLTTPDGCFTGESYSTGAGFSSSGSYNAYKVTQDASNSSSAYQNGAPVQQRGTQMYLYFYVGQFSQSAIEQTAGLNAELFNNKIDINGNNVITEGANKILNTSSYTTNRILEIPQNLSVVADGYTVTITGKATKLDGSQIDVNITRTLSGYGTVGKKYVLYGAGDGDFSGSSYSGQWWVEEGAIPVYNQASQPSVTSQYAFWFDTTNTKLKFTTNTGSTWNEIPLPYCEIELTSSGWKVTNVFNGFGYIGSTVFALPGVKLQFANGMDGNLFKTLLYTTDKVITYTFGNDWTTGTCTTCFMSNGEWTVVTTFGLTEDNWCLANGSRTTRPIIPIFESFYTSGKPTNVKFHSVDFVANSNMSNISSAGRSFISTQSCQSHKGFLVSNSFATSTNFVAPSNGTFKFRGFNTANTYALFLANLSNSTVLPSVGGNWYAGGTGGYGQNITLRVQKGDTISAQHQNIDLSYDQYCGLWFIPDEGEV